jgi:5-formyltetrahydrofolate cyclo-ligase
VAVAFDRQLVAEVPAGDRDLRVAAIVTERRVIRAAHRRRGRRR